MGCRFNSCHQLQKVLRYTAEKRRVSWGFCFYVSDCIAAIQKNHTARRGAGIETGSSRRRCGVWWYNKKQASSEKIPGTLLYNWQTVLCTTSQSASQTRPGCGSQRLLRCRLHPAGRGPNSDSLFPPLAAVVAVAPRGGALGRLGNFLLDA